MQTENCEPLPALEMYSGDCTAPLVPTRSEGQPGIALALDADGNPLSAVVVDDSGTDPTFGSADNPDSCQEQLSDVPQVRLSSRGPRVLPCRLSRTRHVLMCGARHTAAV